jgi:type I restriction enzyme S subunit
MELDYKKKHSSFYGEIPNDWDVKLLPEVFDYIHGKAHEQHIVSSGAFTVVNSKFISSEGKVSKQSSNNFCPAKKGDILTVLSDLPNGKALAKTYYVNVNMKYAVNQRICIWRSKKDYPLFLSYIMNRHKYFMKFDDGVTQTHILNHHIEKCPVLVPSDIKEQNAIATALTDVDELITGLEKLISKKKDIKQGAMQQLLTPPHKGGKRLSGFSGQWEKKQLKSCLIYEQPSKYIVQNSDYEGQSQTPVLTAGKSFLLGYTDEDFGIYDNLPVIIFDDFTTSSQFVNFNFKVKSSAMKMLKPVDNSIDIKFIFSLMNLINFSLGDEHKRRWIGEYSKQIIYVPKIDEQRAISSMIDDMTFELHELILKRKKYQAIKQGMMQELLTGKTRLV